MFASRAGDEWKATLQTNQGLFEPTVMFFGLTNSPATFQWMMNDIFKDLIASGAVTVYLDDVLIMSKNQGRTSAHHTGSPKNLTKEQAVP